MAWKPTLKTGVDLKALPLSPLLGYLASRLDGQSNTHALAQVTGLPEDRVESLLGELTALGAIEPHATASTPVLTAAPVEPISEAPPDARPPAPQIAAEDPVASAESDDAAAQAGGETDPGSANPDGELEPAPLGLDGEPTDSGEPGAEAEGAAPDLSDETIRTHRELFETTLRQLDPEQLAAMAPTVEEPELSALCFAPQIQVIVALLNNSRFGPNHARLVARHHHQPAGLDALCTRSSFAADQGVRRALLQNPQLSVGLYRRLWQGRRLLDQFKVATSHEVIDQTRRHAREVMRNRFTTAAADEKVDLIVKTEGRCLQMLIGLPVDGKTSAMLCSRTYASTTLVQNIARWSPAPPVLISHLLKQDLVRRSPTLRTILLRHPNAPSRQEH